MLILKEPLKLKSLSPIAGRSDGFFDRMNANYQVLWAKYRPEELFHMMSVPPEIYINEGGAAAFITQNENHITQEVRLEMVYNLLNRLMMAGSPQFTYQDSVYVQTMLQKLGVKNVSEFMRQLYEMQEDTQNVRQLSELYEMNLTVLTKAVRNVKEQSEQVRGEPQILYRLHQEIFRRLRSSDVYHTVTAFQKDAVYHYRQIEGQEAGIAEQSRTLSMLRLHELESHVLEERYPLMSHRVNLYEEGMEENYQEETVQNELAGAVLLNLSDHFYQLRINELRENRVFWYQFRGDLKQVLENTLNRFQNSHLQGMSGRSYEFYRSYQESVNAFRRQEISRIKEVLRAEEAPSGEVFLKGMAGLDSPYSKEEVQKVLLDMREELKSRQEEERRIITELTRLVSERELIRRSLDTENKSRVFTDERVHRLSGTEELQAIEEINQVSRELSEGLAKMTGDAVQVKTLEEEVRRLNEENRRKMKEEKESRDTESFREMRESNIIRQTVSVQIDKKKTREETLLLLEHPELAEGYYREEEKTPGRIMDQEEKSFHDRKADREETELRDRRMSQEEREWIHRILGSQESESQEYAGQALNPEERERLEKLLRRAEEEVTLRLAVQEEKQSHIAEEIQVLRQTIDSLERQDTRADTAAQIRSRLAAYRGADVNDRRNPADYAGADIRHRQDALAYEQIHTELETFLTYLSSTSSLSSRSSSGSLEVLKSPGTQETLETERRREEALETERQREEAREGITRIKEALAGKKRTRIETDSREMAVKKLIILKDTLTELEEKMKAEGTVIENIKTRRQNETPAILNRQGTYNLRKQGAKTEQPEKPGAEIEYPQKTETEAEKLKRTGTEAEKLKRTGTETDAGQLKKTGAEVEELIEKEFEIRQTYAKTLKQIRRIINGLKIEEKSGADVKKTRQVLAQQKTLLKLLDSSESVVLMRSEADRKHQTMQLSKEFYEKRREIVRTYLDIIGERHVSEERMLRGVDSESVRIHRETAAGRVLKIHKEEEQSLIRSFRDIDWISEAQKTYEDRKIEMYHKPQESFDREMLMEEIQNKRSQVLYQNTENIRITGQTHTQKNFTEQQAQVQAENMNELIQKGVQRGVKRQIDNISNQVYRKLERRLSDDRKRRGL